MGLLDRLEKLKKGSVLERLAALDAPDVRTQIAERQANPPAAAKGDPRVKPQSTLEEVAPFIAHPIETAKGFGSTLAGGVQALAHPIEAVKSDWNARGAAYDRIAARGIGSDDPENLRDAAEMILPGVGPAFAGAGRQMNSTDPNQRAQGTGAAIALTAGPEIVKRGVGVALPTREAQVVKVQRIIDPKNENPGVARPIAERLIDEGKVLTDPREQLTAIQEQRTAAADTGINQAIDQMPNPVDLAAVNKNLDAAKQAQTQPFGPDSAATIKGIDKFQTKVLPRNANAGGIDPAAARELRQQFDAKPYGTGSTTADTMARKAVGDALREQLNLDPDVKAANETFQREKAGKDLAEAIPKTKAVFSGKSVPRMVTESAATGLAHMVDPTVGKYLGLVLGGGELIKFARNVMASPGFKTWSAVQKARFAEAVKAGKLETVAKMGTQAGVALEGGMDEQELSKVLGGTQ